MKKKLSEGKSKFTDEQYTNLEQILTEESDDKTYKLSELKELLGEEVKNETSHEGNNGLKDKLKGTKDNWLLLVLGIFFASFVIYLLKKIGIYIFKE